MIESTAVDFSVFRIRTASERTILSTLSEAVRVCKDYGDPVLSVLSAIHQVTVMPAHEMASTQRKMDRLGTSEFQFLCLKMCLFIVLCKLCMSILFPVEISDRNGLKI